MKIDNDLMKKVLIGGMALVFIMIAMTYAFEKDNVKIFVNGDEVEKDTITIGSVISTTDVYEYDPNENIEISAVVTNDRNQDYDFIVKVWEETSLSSQDNEIYESDPVTIAEGETFTFLIEHNVPLEPGTYFYSIKSYYAPVGHINFATYDDGTYFTVTVLDTTPVTYDNDVEEIETPEPTATGTPITLVTDIPCPVTEEDDKPLIDLDDENTQIGIGLIIMVLIPIIGYFAIRHKKKDN